MTPAAGAEEKRTHVLSNGVTLWDLAGNVWQWVLDNNDSNAGNMGVSSALRAANTAWEYNNASLTDSDKLLFGGSYGYTSAKNAGKIVGAANGAVQRGGSWGDGAQSGLFSAYLFLRPTQAYSSIGFRCAYVP